MDSLQIIKTINTALEKAGDHGYEGAIIVLFTLFVASTVNERIIEFIKIRKPGLYLKSTNAVEETERHKKVWWVAFGMGLITSLLMDIDFNDLISENKLSLDGFGSYNTWFSGEDDNIRLFFMESGGYLFTALFLSMGSKFWHDLLDIVLQVKNAKRKIGGFQPQSVFSIAQIDKYLNEDDFDIAQRALDGNLEELEKTYPGASITACYDNINNEFRIVILIIARAALQSKAIAKISYVTDYGYIYNFPIKVVKPERPVTTLTNPEEMEAGGILYNVQSKTNKGTFGCIVYNNMDGKKSKQILTCYHCVKTKNHRWDRFKPIDGDENIEYLSNSGDSTADKLGTILWAYRDGLMDVAIIEPDNENLVKDLHLTSSVSIPKGHRKVLLKDGKDRTDVIFSGMTSGFATGKIIHKSISVEVKYPDNDQLHTLDNLILFSKKGKKPYIAPCAEGDSGAILMDANSKEALGMIVAADDMFGYAIPIDDILVNHNLSVHDDLYN